MSQSLDQSLLGAAEISPTRGIYCNRTLNLRGVKAIGYDMDYTLIHYHVDAWERRAYAHLRDKLAARGWPVQALNFDPEMMVRGLVIDLKLGNVVKPNRFGYVKQASHGTRGLPFDEQRELYSRTIVDLAEERFVFANTLFSHSEVCMYAQLVDIFDQERAAGRAATLTPVDYGALYREVKASLDEAHMEGALKAEIVANPERFVDLDPDTPKALLDQQRAGKKLMLITNSEWDYTRAMMAYAFDRFLPEGMVWRDLFEVVIVAARKPAFFFGTQPLFEVADLDQGLLRPVVGGLAEESIYVGGSAAQVEQRLGLSADQVLYVGDHLLSDVHVSKHALRWRTALIVRELEAELEALSGFGEERRELRALMAAKEVLERRGCLLRLALQRQTQGYGAQPELGAGQLREELARVREQLATLDEQLAPLAKASAELTNARWGPLMRAGNDKSLFARQVERHADIYLSRVSNFYYHSPFVYLRSPHGSLPHDPGLGADE